MNLQFNLCLNVKTILMATFGEKKYILDFNVKKFYALYTNLIPYSYYLYHLVNQ